MFARLSADTDLIRAYGSASSDHAADLQAAAARLTAVSAAATIFGPIGGRFLAALTRAAEDEARAVTDLSDSIAAARSAAWGSAQVYERADADAGTRLAWTR